MLATFKRIREMPKRNTEFQKLITQIYQQLANSDTRISENVEMKEQVSGTFREIDILLEHKIADIEIKVAIECQHRSRKADVTWIDALIGKYQNLPIDRVIAISSKGFSHAANRKAARNRIELRTLEAAININWVDEFDKIAIGQLKTNVEPLFFIIETVPKWPENADFKIVLIEGVPVDLDIFYESLFSTIKDLIEEFLDSQFGEPFYWGKTVTSFCQSYTIDFDSTEIISNDGVKRKLVSLKIPCEISMKYHNIENNHFLFGESAVTIAKTLENENISLVQNKGESIRESIGRKNSSE